MKLDKLISQGAELFFEKTIDKKFIAGPGPPDNDPLFVAEFNPALANLERPDLMRG